MPRPRIRTDSSSQEVRIGGIIYVRGTTRPLSYFSERVPDFIVKHWATARKQVIAQAELFAVLVCKWVWKVELNGTPTFHA
eukprot:2790608-Amphidinium_carterae.1